MSGQIRRLPILDELAQHLLRPVSTHARRQAAVRVADWAGCAAAGAREPAGQIMLAGADHSAEGEAFAWGSLGNILEMDDVDKRALLHPGPVIIPAALALSIAAGASAQQFLDSVVRGYEATIRLGRAVGPGHYRLWHNTGTCGSIGAAAACAFILGLAPDRLVHAMALGISQSAGLWQTRHEPASQGKQLHTAHASRSGVTAARLAASGFAGPRYVLEGPQGFFAAMCPGADPVSVLAPYESDWLIRDVSTKPWPACRHTHAAIDAALLLRADAAQPASGTVLVETYQDALAFCDNPSPGSALEAKFSLQHAVAVALARGAPRLDDFSLPAIADPQLSELRARVLVRESGALTLAYPSRFGARVSLDGASVEVGDAWGDPENPVTDDDVFRKSGLLLDAAGWPKADAENLLGAVRALVSGDGLDRLAAGLRAHL